MGRVSAGPVRARERQRAACACIPGTCGDRVLGVLILFTRAIVPNESRLDVDVLLLDVGLLEEVVPGGVLKSLLAGGELVDGILVDGIPVDQRVLDGGVLVRLRSRIGALGNAALF